MECGGYLHDIIVVTLNKTVRMRLTIFFFNEYVLLNDISLKLRSNKIVHLFDIRRYRVRYDLSHVPIVISKLCLMYSCKYL